MDIDQLNSTYDLVVIGGGITGAGIFREATGAGLSTLLIDKQDFAAGTSSRSSKLVHGGLRYLKQGNFILTKHSVTERCRLINEVPGLVDRLGFLWPLYEGQSPGRFMLGMGLWIYDLMARERQHRHVHTHKVLEMAPQLSPRGLTGGFLFSDAQVDDARLVLRLIFEGRARGGTAASYTGCLEIHRGSDGCVEGLTVEDIETQKTRRIETRAVINATGWWAETIQPSPDPSRHLRPLRGSHIVFPNDRLPLPCAVSFLHPADHRPLFAIPWEGATILGTTDLDHKSDLYTEPRMSREELDYLMAAVNSTFAPAELTEDDIISSFAGVRPVLSSGKKDPSKESREHVVWVKKGLVTVTGGKLTTFRLLANDALRAVAPFLSRLLRLDEKAPVFTPSPDRPDQDLGVPLDLWRRLFGRYGAEAQAMVAQADPEDRDVIPGTLTLWCELPHAAKNEQVRHLSDLMLRRTRLGLLCPSGGADHLDRIQGLCAPHLAWSEKRWEEERAAYLKQWEEAYHLPPR